MQRRIKLITHIDYVVVIRLYSYRRSIHMYAIMCMMDSTEIVIIRMMVMIMVVVMLGAMKGIIIQRKRKTTTIRIITRMHLVDAFLLCVCRRNNCCYHLCRYVSMSSGTSSPASMRITILMPCNLCMCSSLRPVG